MVLIEPMFISSPSLSAGFAFERMSLNRIKSSSSFAIDSPFLDHIFPQSGETTVNQTLCNRNVSLINVPVLSKQQVSTNPANGIRNSSVQYT